MHEAKKLFVISKQTCTHNWIVLVNREKGRRNRSKQNLNNHAQPGLQLLRDRHATLYQKST